MRMRLPILALSVLLLAAAEAGSEPVPTWVAPTVFGGVVAVVGWIFSQLVAAVKAAHRQDVARLEDDAKRMREALSDVVSANTDLRQGVTELRLDMKDMASKEFVREMEREFSATLRTEIAGLRVVIENLQREIHSGRGSHSGTQT